MERPAKQPRLSYNGHDDHRGAPQLQQQQQFAGGDDGRPQSSGGITEEELCELLNEETLACQNGEDTSDGRFLHWLSDYVGSQAIYQLSPATLLQLHGWLILQLGCTTVDDRDKRKIRAAKASAAKDVPTTTTTGQLILSCLRSIYLTHSISALLNPQELDETFQAHVRQVTQIVHGTLQENSNQYQQQGHHEAMINPCIRSIDSLFDAQVERSGRIIRATSFGANDQLKDFVLSVLAVFRSDKKGDGTYSINFPAHQLLLKLANTTSSPSSLTTTRVAEEVGTICPWARIARQVADDAASRMAATAESCRVQFAEVQQRYHTQAEWLFHVECLAFLATRSADRFGMEQADIDELARLAGDKKNNSRLAARAARCLAIIARKSDFSESIFLKAATVFLTADQVVKTHILPGLCGKGIKVLLGGDDKMLKNVVSTLVDLILTASDHGNVLEQGELWVQKASCLLCEVLTWAGESSTSISHQDIVSICFVFLENSYPEAIECAVNTLHNLVDKLYFSDVNAAALFEGLATPLLSTSATVETRQKALDLYTILTARRPSNLSHLARRPIALEGLVRAASSQQRSNALLRQSAVSILLHMSEDPGHHRIMAKQTGLLSLLIRYVREEESIFASSPMSPQSETAGENVIVSSPPPNREVIKANIMQIAAAL
mmetsp:Transcript_26450/g.73028  ORF Transcript_26450/g.73028 Transcript_26450/m.73028 type:complete len:666 (+) Transcript_26450:106-2103(+)